MAFWGQKIDDAFQGSGTIRKLDKLSWIWLIRNKVGWKGGNCKRSPFYNSNNLPNSMLQSLSKSRTWLLLQDSSPVLNQWHAYFPWIRDQKIVFKVFLYVVVWWVYNFFSFRQVFPLSHLSQLMLPIWHFPSGPDCYKSFCCFQPQIIPLKGAVGWAVWRAPPPEEGRFLQYLRFLTLKLSQVRFGVAPLQQRGLPQYQRIQMMLILCKKHFTAILFAQS